jgi:hypothetical protein
MKSLRTMVLVLAVAAVSFSAKQAFSQQEVDPDHFDQPVAAKRTPTAHKASAHQRAHGRATLASKRSKHRHSKANG